MEFLIGPEWTELFDVIVAQARKPLFFNDISRYAILQFKVEMV